MSSAPTAHRTDIQHLVEDGYEVEVRHDHLLVHAVPYLISKSEVRLGTLACVCADAKPPDHVVFFAGGEPCGADGQPLPHLALDSNTQTLFDTFIVNRRFSNKPTGVQGFPADYYVKMVHYVSLLQAQAKAVDPDADARTYRVVPPFADDSVFLYADSASARAGIFAISQKLAVGRIAIIGLGGTGGYILDQVAKTPVKRIDLYDGDDFKRHNAFRTPGAASTDSLQRRLKKVHYFQEMYSPMRRGIEPHPYYINATNLNELIGFDFVFVCVDDGQSRKLICGFLTGAGTPFIDVGMGLERTADPEGVLGLSRVTLGTQTRHDHLERRLPVEEDKDEALYRSNIQVADMNAMNAILAVMRWKQYFGFYADYQHAHHLSFSVAAMSLVREEIGA